MEMTLCDWCPKDQMVSAQYRLTCTRMSDGSSADTPPIDLCANHYETFWQFHLSHGEVP